ncbi:hypothetical protein [Streptacidiphilus rugosus]|uniref:hypothetical protein n=1 Tax=Streptacidiphilus rugosus TaxID=405783 RepID=UPI0009FBE06A|nr:hypothetical protein [Streptacidiphilus rugosus]
MTPDPRALPTSHAPAAIPGATGDPAVVRRALDEGRAVVLPNPAPLTCVVTATRPAAVNTAKGRPDDQAVALWAHHPDTLHRLAGLLDLGPAEFGAARRLLGEHLVTLLVPLRQPGGAPDWLAPATRGGWTLLFGARPRPLVPLLDTFPLLYVSSANRTGHPPAPTPEAAVGMFGPGVTVLVGTDEPSPTRPEERRATTTVRLHPDGRLELHRHGAQDHAFADPGAYLAHLREVCRG